MTAAFFSQDMDYAEVLGPRRIMLSVNAQWVEIASAQYRTSSNAPVVYGVIRDPDSGLVVPLRSGCRLDFGSRRIERLELEITQSGQTCSVDFIIGTGAMTPAPRVVTTIPFRAGWRQFATKAVITSTGVWLGVLTGSPGTDRTYISAPPTNTQVVYVGFTTDAIGGVPQGLAIMPGTNFVVDGLPDLYVRGPVLNEWVNILRTLPIENAGTLPP